MTLTVVGSIAFDAVETPSGSRDRLLGGSAVHFSLASSQLAETRIVGPGRATTSARRSTRSCTRAASLTDDVEHVARRQDVLLGRPLPPRHQPARHAADRPQRLRGLPAEAVARVARRRGAVPGQHPARAAARGARAVRRRAVRRDGLDEPVDRHRARGAAADDLARRLPGAQRLRAQAAHRRAEPDPRRAQGARARAARRDRQAGRVRLGDDHARRLLRPDRLPDDRRSSSRPAPATRSPAG